MDTFDEYEGGVETMYYPGLINIASSIAPIIEAYSEIAEALVETLKPTLQMFYEFFGSDEFKENMRKIVETTKQLVEYVSLISELNNKQDTNLFHYDILNDVSASNLQETKSLVSAPNAPPVQLLEIFAVIVFNACANYLGKKLSKEELMNKLPKFFIKLVITSWLSSLGFLPNVIALIILMFL